MIIPIIILMPVLPMSMASPIIISIEKLLTLFSAYTVILLKTIINNSMNKYVMIGSLTGYLVFIMYLECKPLGMGNVYMRCGKFRPSGIIHYMKSAFTKKYMWLPHFWCANWIIMTCAGGLVGKMIST
jgi:hypothetical protein